MSKNNLTQLSFDLLHALNSLSNEELEIFIAKNSVIVKSLNSKLSKDSDFSELNKNDVIFNNGYEG